MTDQNKQLTSKRRNEAVKTSRETNQEPEVAPGMWDFLELSANPEEKEKGEFTKVTTLSFDETH